VTFDGPLSLKDAETANRELRSTDLERLRPSVDETALDGLKCRLNWVPRCWRSASPMRTGRGTF
jgi:hypothetical protein